MTHNEILNMPAGREMDALIAEKIFGNFVHRLSGGKYGIGSLMLEIPNYSTDIADAWEVAEKLHKENDIFDVWHEKDTGFDWWCEVVNNGGGWSANAKNAPLAICRAALLAVMEAE